MQVKTIGTNGSMHRSSEMRREPLGASFGVSRPDLLREEVLSDIIAATLAKRPQKIAIVAGDKSWTYRALDEEATAWARGLVRAGIGPGHVVGLWMPRGAEVLIAQIAIAKAGAAWLPFDADAPVDRIATCLADADARMLLTAPANVDRLAGFEVAIRTPQGLVDADDTTLINPRLRGLTPDHAAYLIYTSGSTGKPKGVAITHRNICHYLRSANTVYGIGADDVVFQGASVAFDLSMEEIWVPYLTGATLWVATADILGQADRLTEILSAARVTVLDTVPTLLAMLSGDVPSLRIIILGGEACPAGLIDRWSKPGRHIFNSYGPTEATVVATIAELRPGEPVTIGRPIPNYTCYIVDDAMQRVVEGSEGELLLGGPGIAGGYLARPDLTAQKFVANPFGEGSGDPVLYRTGDAAAFDVNGNIEFRGRIDDQVKIRGFRVELGEIEAALAELPGVVQAATVLRNDGDIDQLVAFVRTAPSAGFDEDFARATLRARLPAYMVPQHFELIETLPTMVSGKLDRKTLKALPLTFKVSDETQEDPRSLTEAVLLKAARDVFPGRAIPFDADFFTDLGGHSLLAARFISAVRQTANLSGITLKDMYAERSLRKLGRTLDARATAKAEAAPVAPVDNVFTPVPVLRRFWCGLAQAAVMPFILAMSTGEWLSVYIVYSYITPAGASFLVDSATVIGLFAVVQILNIAFALAVKWLVLGRTKPGRYPLWGSYYFRIWLAHQAAGLAHEGWLQGTVLYRVYLRMMGAKVGRDAVIGSVKIELHDLLDIGSDVSIGAKTTLANFRVEGNEFVVGPITIRDKVVIGGSSVIENDVMIEEGAEIGDITSVREGTVIPAWQRWEGSPARKVADIDPASIAAPAAASARLRALQTVVYLLGLIFIPPLGIIPILPALYLVDKLDEYAAPLLQVNYLYYLPLLAWPAAIASIALSVAFVTAMRWLIMPTRVQPGVYSVHSWFYVRRWALEIATDIDVLGSLLATVYMRAWYRCMGMKIGKDSEISTTFPARYDLIEIGEKCFIADDTVVGEEEIRHGWMTLRRVKVGNQVFVGNSAVVAQGTNLPDRCLIGVVSKAPEGDTVREGETWFGSPAIRFPVRQTFESRGPQWTFKPTRLMRLRRAVVELLNASFPTMLMIAFGTACMEAINPWLEDDNLQVMSLVAFCIGMSVVLSLIMTLASVAQKWLLMGVYRPNVQPMWSWWALRSESVAVAYTSLASKSLLDHLCGTPMLPWMLRLFGAKIGKGVFMNTNDLTEFDCVTIGDHTVLNTMSLLQTHLYEDRMMKVGRISVGSGVTVGHEAFVLYDTRIGDHAKLASLTVVMKGESLPGNSNWSGSPAEAR